MRSKRTLKLTRGILPRCRVVRHPLVEGKRGVIGKRRIPHSDANRLYEPAWTSWTGVTTDGYEPVVANTPRPDCPVFRAELERSIFNAI